MSAQEAVHPFVSQPVTDGRWSVRRRSGNSIGSGFLGILAAGAVIMAYG